MAHHQNQSDVNKDAATSGDASEAAGLDVILSALTTDPTRFDRPADDVVRRCVTYDGRVPLDHARETLSPFGAELLELLEGAPPQPLLAAPQRDGTSLDVALWFDSYGKLWLRPDGDPLPDYLQGRRWEVGCIVLSPHLHTQLTRTLSIRAAEEQRIRRQLDRMLERAEAEGTLGELLDRVEDSVRHVEAVYLYIDDHLWSVMEGAATLVARRHGQGMIGSLRDKPLAEWTSTERFGVVALRALFLSGRSVRFEEFNGAHLTAVRLVERLRELSDGYSTRRGVPVEGDADDVFAWAAEIRKGAESSVGQPWIRFRRINGLTYVKNECLASIETPDAVSLLPSAIVKLYEQWTGKSYQRGLSHVEVFRTLTCHAIAHRADPSVRHDTPAAGAVESLIQAIVGSAVVSTGADYGMSSSLRDITPLLQADRTQLVADMNTLKPADFFTCVVARAGLEQDFGPEFRKRIYTAIQRRMQFNRWHFIVGNFTSAEIDGSRHWFYPPLIPDIAEWSDQRHAGHTKAGVRFSVRAPGPDMGEVPLEINGNPYRGFYDVRVARTGGVPFTVREMLVTRRHCLWMGVVWGEIVAACTRAPGSFTIKGFEAGDGLELDGIRSLGLLRSEPVLSSANVVSAAR